MKQILLGTSPNHMKRRLSKVVTASLLTSCFALLPIIAQADNQHRSPTPTPTPTLQSRHPRRSIHNYTITYADIHPRWRPRQRQHRNW